ncbi:phage Gp37/Gp68 family protein [Paenibacillus sp. TRM 82003]|nr:phage Gp37/Gp68 family protein [Paenibacillus sp. TRM 82003]
MSEGCRYCYAETRTDSFERF